MTTYPDLVATILSETLACQDPSTPQSRGRTSGQYRPFGPFIPGESGGYPTTDAAMAALADIADRFRTNDQAILLAVNRDACRMMTSKVIGELLPDIAAEPDAAKHWLMIRDKLRETLRNVGRDVVHYVPVWLFLGQVCAPFSIGPVRFIERKDWLDAVASRRGQPSSWMPGVRTIWSGGRLPEGSCWSGIEGALRAAVRSPRDPGSWIRAFRGARRQSQSRDQVNARTVARTVHPDQWVACADIAGFEREESRLRGILAVRVALDTIRLALPGPHRRRLSTVADSVVPLSIERLSQIGGQDLAHGSGINRPGVSGAPGMADAVLKQAAPLFEGAGSCLTVVAATSHAHACPKLAERWCNAVHWFGRACLSDGDFVAVVMLVIALDVLCGGKEGVGITELTARLADIPKSTKVLPDGTSLDQLVYRTYKLRSEVAHGSILAVNATLDVERAQLEELAAGALSEYAIRLHGYAKIGGDDDRDAFLASLPPLKP